MTQAHIALLVLRVAVGSMIIMHGVAHITKRGKLTIAGTARWFGSMGMRYPMVQAWTASITELGGGALLISGLFTSLGAAGVLGVMLVAWIIAHRRNGFFIYNAGQGWEYVAILCAVALTIGTLGPGKYSIDHAIDLTWYTGWTGLCVTLLGALGALVLLATCWRPPAPAAPAAK